MLKVIIPLALLFASSLINADDTKSPVACGHAEAQYAAIAFQFYLLEVRSNNIPSVETLKEPYIFDIGSTSRDCVLSGSDFSAMVGVNASFLSIEQIKLLAIDERTQTYHRIFGAPGAHIGEIVFNLGSFGMIYDGQLSWGGCSFEVVVVDSDGDGVPETVDWPEGSGSSRKDSAACSDPNAAVRPTDESISVE